MGELEEIAEGLENVIMGYEAEEPKDEARRRFTYSFNSDLDRAEALREDLLERYEGSDLTSETGLEVVNSEYGAFLHGEEVVDKKFVKPEPSARDLLSDLKLIYGIGEVRERELKDNGYEAVDDLIDHPRWGKRASSLLNEIGNGDPVRTYDLLSRWKPSSHPDFLQFSGLFREEDFAFVDIETMGLSNQPIFLLGLAHPDGGEARVHQFLARDPSQEVAALNAFTDYMDERRLVLTYNGLRFDAPYIERRLAYYGINWRFTQPHIDLFRFARNTVCQCTRNCKLGTVESSVLGVDRDLDVPSSQVPDFYRTFIDTGNPGPVLPVLSHHRQDMLSLFDLYRVLAEVSSDGD